MIVVFPFLFSKRFAGIALWPFILVKSKVYKTNAVFINHERIHLRQQLELLVLPFYLWYVIEFLIRWMHYKNRNLAYRNISFEREAYSNEANLHYLKNRKCWSFAGYLEKENRP